MARRKYSNDRRGDDQLDARRERIAARMAKKVDASGVTRIEDPDEAEYYDERLDHMFDCLRKGAVAEFERGEEGPHRQRYRRLMLMCLIMSATEEDIDWLEERRPSPEERAARAKFETEWRKKAAAGNRRGDLS